MTTHVSCAVQAICLLILTSLSLQKSIGSPRTVTQWELEFVGLHFHQSLEGYPCSADGTVSSGLPLFLVVGYTLPNRHAGKVGLTVERPDVSCSDGAARFRSSGSPSRMTISVVNDKACSEEARLQLHINIHTKQGSKPMAYFFKEVYSLQAGPDWSWALLPDAKETTLLALKWRESCGEQDEQNPGFLQNSIRLKRQATNEDPTENTLPDSGSELKHSSFPTSKSPGIPEASGSPQTSVTGQGGGLTTLQEDSETFSSGEPPDSFVTGISEIFGLTKKPLSALASRSTHPSTSSLQFTTLLQTLFGPSADVTTLIDRSSSFSTDSVSLDDTYTSLSSSHRSSPSPTKLNPGSDKNFTEHRTTSAINAPAAGDGNSQTPDLAGSQADSDLDNTTKPDTNITENSTETVFSLSATTPADNPAEGVDITARESATNPESQDGVSSSQPATETGITETTRPSPSSLLTRVTTTTTSTASSATHGHPISTTTTANKPEQEATSDTNDDQTKASSVTSTTPSRTTKAPSPTTTTTATPATSKATKPSTATATTTSDTPTRTIKQSTPPTASTSPTPARTTKSPISTTTPTRTSKPSTTTTATTASTIATKTPKPSTTTTTTSTKTTSTTITTTTPKPDVIFTQSKTKPTPTYPETSNEAYMGKTGDESSAGRIDETSEPKKDSEKTNEATLWPVVMGLVIGIPTIIVLAIAITVVQKKHIGVPHRHLSSPGYFERRPPQVPFVIVSKHEVSSTVI